MSLRFLYLDFNSFFASCEQQENPQFRGKPLAVAPMKVPSATILAASYEAKAFGIRTGTKVFEAKKKCPQILFTDIRHQLYTSYHEKLKAAAEDVLPIHSIRSIDEMCFELIGREREEAAAMELALKLKKHLAEKVGPCLTSSIGIAPNILLAKMASDMQKPNGLVLLPLERVRERLLQLELRDIPGVGPQMEQRMISRGLRTMENLLNLGPQEMKSLWGGIVGEKYYHLLRGLHFEPKDSETKSLGHEHVLPPKLRNKEDALRTLEQLLWKACVRIRKQKTSCRRMEIKVKFFQGEPIWIRTQFEKTQETLFLLERMRSLLNEKDLALKWKGKPIKVSVMLSSFESTEHEQLSFFEKNNKREDLFHLIDNINAKHGKGTVTLANFLSRPGKN